MTIWYDICLNMGGITWLATHNVVVLKRSDDLPTDWRGLRGTHALDKLIRSNTIFFVRKHDLLSGLLRVHSARTCVNFRDLSFERSPPRQIPLSYFLTSHLEVDMAIFILLWHSFWHRFWQSFSQMERQCPLNSGAGSCGCWRRNYIW